MSTLEDRQRELERFKYDKATRSCYCHTSKSKPRCDNCALADRMWQEIVRQIAREERERAAKAVEGMPPHATVRECAAAIRSLGDV